jgi:tRNA modification GTPase
LSTYSRENGKQRREGFPLQATDTIAAPATPPGQGGVAILRISGPRAAEVLARVFRARSGEPVEAWPSHRLTLGTLAAPDGSPIDEAMAVLMRAPRSYTREDVAELHCHGGPWVVGEALRLAVAAGARTAEPGEFTRRAFEHGRIDLSQAEAVMALIGAQGERAAREALRQAQGGVSRFVIEARAEATRLLAGVEAALDFPEEIGDAEANESFTTGGRALAASLRGACDPRTGRLLREGLDVVLAGRPNVGKSTLLNALLGEDRAIVTDAPGTTRDTLTERLMLDGLAVRLTDTAGLREGGDAAEALGVARARAALDRADVLLLVLDASAPLTPEDRALLAEVGARAQPRIIALNKADLPARISMQDVEAAAGGPTESPEEACGARPKATPPASVIVGVSARTGEGVPALRAALRDQAALPGSQHAALTQARHIAAAEDAASALEDACAALDAGMPPDVAAIDLHRALDALGSVTGETLREDVIDAIFVHFCVGK